MFLLSLSLTHSTRTHSKNVKADPRMARDTHSPICTLLGKAPIVSPQKPENIKRKQSGEEILILLRL